ncbi:formylglycine-generating enzyme family protein [bacterium]|nr:formylglycine-generating enzyme family protein [bacterium]
MMSSQEDIFTLDIPPSIVLLFIIILILGYFIFRSEINPVILYGWNKIGSMFQKFHFPFKRRTGNKKTTVKRKHFHFDVKALESQMIFIEGGCFQMGDLFNEGASNEYPLHEVWLSDYYLSDRLVTQEQWIGVMGNNLSRFSYHKTLPVENVSYDDALEFISRINAACDEKYRLPTEAEWEFAARERGRDVRFGNGKNIADPSEINFNADISFLRKYSRPGKFFKGPSPVGSFPANALGLFDMSGNLFEWLLDYYQDSAYLHHTILDPVCTHKNSFRVARGGSWNNHASRIRCSCRSYFNPSVRNSLVGFRLAKSK